MAKYIVEETKTSKYEKNFKFPLANVESYFTIKNDEKHYTAEEFLRISNNDGSIIYLI